MTVPLLSYAEIPVTDDCGDVMVISSEMMEEQPEGTITIECLSRLNPAFFVYTPENAQKLIDAIRRSAKNIGVELK